MVGRKGFAKRDRPRKHPAAEKAASEVFPEVTSSEEEGAESGSAVVLGEPQPKVSVGVQDATGNLASEEDHRIWTVTGVHHLFGPGHDNGIHDCLREGCGLQTLDPERNQPTCSGKMGK